MHDEATSDDAEARADDADTPIEVVSGEVIDPSIGPARDDAARRRDRDTAFATGATDTDTDAEPAPYVAPQRRPIATYVLLGAIAIMTLIEFVRFGLSPTVAETARAGGSSIGAIALNDWWKLLAANFLHGGLLHVTMNMIVLIIVGTTLEREVGHRVFVAVVAWSLIGTSVGAIALSSSVSVGASGIAFALLGAGIVADPHRRTPLGAQAWGLLPINVIITFAAPGISIGGHLGGLAAGVIIGWATCSRHASPRSPRVVSAVMIAGVALCLTTALGPRIAERTSPGKMDAINAAIVGPKLERELHTTLGGRTSSQRVKIDGASCVRADGFGPTVWECSLDINGNERTAEVRFDNVGLWSVYGL